MKLYYRDSRRTPSNGDIKVLKSGKKSIRRQRTYNGMYVVSYGKPVYDWLDFDDERVKLYKDMFESKGIKGYYEQRQKEKTKSQTFNMQTEFGRRYFEQLTGIKSNVQTKLTKVKVETKKISF